MFRMLLKKVHIGLLLCCFLTSCKKNEEAFGAGQESLITISIPKISELSSDDVFASFDKKGLHSHDSIQEEIVPLGDGSYIIATLEAQNKSMRKKELLGTTLPPVTSHLSSGVKYKLIVYSISGQYITERDYTAGSEGSAEALTLSGGQKFIFVAYSTNTNTLPVILDAENLSTAKLDDVSEDLMYYKETIFINPSTENRINIVLQHKFTSITTTMKLTESTDAIGKTVGNIYNINDLRFSNLSATGGIGLESGKVTYSDVDPSVIRIAKVNEGKSPVRSVTSEPVILIAPEGNVTKLSIPAITLTDGMNEYTQSIDRISLSKIKIVPGHRYNLVLKIYKPCTTLVTNKYEYSYFIASPSSTQEGTNTPIQTLTIPAADFGYTLDILALDNSFDMSINNVKIATAELQFQGSVNSLPKNIRFAGETSDYGNGFPQIYSMYPHGTATNEAYPVVRIVVPAATGKVQLFGSKKQGGPLAPLEVYGVSLNNVTWNKTTSNTIRFSQKRTGQTEMIIRGYGRKITDCP